MTVSLFNFLTVYLLTVNLEVALLLRQLQLVNQLIDWFIVLPICQLWISISRRYESHG